MAATKASQSLSGVGTRPSEVNSLVLAASAPLMPEPPMSRQVIIFVACLEARGGASPRCCRAGQAGMSRGLLARRSPDASRAGTFAFAAAAGHDAADNRRPAVAKAYDAIIIGAGQSGPFLAVRLATAGRSVALIER